jgi:type VI secretion system protein VasG
MEGGAELARARTHYEVEVEHYLLKLLDQTDNDALRIFRHQALDTSKLSKELLRSIDKLKTGNARIPALSPAVEKMLTDAWMIGSIDFGGRHIRTGFTIVALATVPDSMRMLSEVSHEWQKVDGRLLRNEALDIVSGSPEDGAATKRV